MEIKIDVSNVDLSSVIDAQYRQVGEDEYASSGVRLGDVVASRIADDLKRDDSYLGLRKRVMGIRDEEIRALVRDQVTAALEAPLQQTNHYGEPTGQSTTLRELIMVEATKFFTEKTGDYNSPKFTAAERAIAAAVKDVLTKEITELVAEEKKKVVAAVRSKAGEIIADAVKQGLR